MNVKKTYHIVLGTPQRDLADLGNDASAGETIHWTINSKAKVNDSVLFYFIAPVSSIVAKAVVLTDAERTNNPGDYWCYMHNVVMLEKLIPLSMIRDSISQWGYWKTPIQSTRVPGEFVAQLEVLLNGLDDVTTRSFPDIDEIDVTAIEGHRKLVVHYRIERDQTIVRKKKAQVLRKKGKLECEVCAFDFEKRYGELGEGFCEVHHKIPLSKVKGQIKTKLEDLAVVCSNCHRVIHRKKPLLSIGELKKLLMM